MSEIPKGMVAIVTGRIGRYRDFDRCVDKSNFPEGTVIERRFSVNLVYNLNNMIREMLKDNELQWLWILGDDHVFEPDLFEKLYARNVDVVAPLYVKRAYPFGPVVHKGKEGKYFPYRYDYLKGKTGCIELKTETIGDAGMLIKRKVLEAIGEPYFEVGRTHPEHLGYDLYFCERVRECGFKLHLDLDNPIGHIIHVALYPERNDNNEYKTEIRFITLFNEEGR